MATSYQYTAQSGLGNSAAYQVSGYPQVNSGTTTTPDTINYDRVTSQVTIANNDTNSVVLGIQFDGGTLFNLPAGNTITVNIKCRQVIVTPDGATGSWSVIAALTTIDKSELPAP